MTAKFFRAAPYADDAMNLPVRDIEAAIPFYESKMGFSVASRSDDGCRRVVLERDTIQIGLAENGGDPSQKVASLRWTTSRRLQLSFGHMTRVSKRT